MPSMAPPYTNFLGGPVFWGQVIFVAEMNMGQITTQVKQVVQRPDRVFLVNRMDGLMLNPTDIGKVMRVIEGRGF